MSIPDRGLVSAIVLLALFSSSLVYICGWTHQVPGSFYSGMRELNASDYNVNLSWIHQFRKGNILLQNLYASRPHEGFLFRPVYALLAIPFGLLPVSNGFVFHFLRLFCGTVLLFILFRVLKELIPQRNPRIIAFLLLCFSSGAGFITRYWIRSADLEVPEYFLFLSLGEPPHFLYSLLFLWLGVAAVYRLLQGQSTALALYGIMLFLLCLEHPFDSVTLGSIGIAAGWLFCKWKEKIAILLITLTIGLITIVYYWKLQRIPAFAGWATQNQMMSPSWSSLLSAFAPLLSLAAIGAIRIWKTGNHRLCFFLLLWIVLQFLLSQMPFSFQRRLLSGVQLPLAVLASYGLFPIRRIAQIAIIVLLSLTNWTVLLFQIKVVESGRFPFFVPDSYIEAFNWLSRQEQAIVCSGFVTGNFIPAYTGQIVYLGHSALTPRSSEKKKEIRNFFKSPNKTFLLQNGIRYLWIGLEEKQASIPQNVLLNQGVKMVFSNRDVAIFSIPK